MAFCLVLAMELQRVIVIEGDATDRDLLQEEEVDKTDFIVALTNDEENNILVGLLAKALGAKKAIVRINRLSYMPLVSSIGVDMVVSSRLAAVKAILSFIRRGKVLSVTPLRTGDAEVIEAEAVKGSLIVNRPLKEVNLPKGSIVGAVVRGEEVFIPKGTTVIRPGDRLIIFAIENVVPKVERFLGPE
jgi:trk system potassium uptake protein TrkA